MRKTFYAVVAAALIAACLTLAPMLSEVEAGAPPATGKSDRADARPLAADCSEKAWPYVEAACLRDTRNPLGQAREVRMVPLDQAQKPTRPVVKLTTPKPVAKTPTRTAAKPAPKIVPGTVASR
jgi:hypothetical protein